MRVLTAALISLSPIICLASDKTDTSQDRPISATKIERQKVTISGRASSNYELVLRIEKTKGTKQLEWTSPLDGKFDAELTSTDKVPLSEGKCGKGIVFKVQRSDSIGSTFNIAMSDRDPVPDGDVRFRPEKSGIKNLPAITKVGNSITVADIVRDDGTAIPISVLVRERQITKP